jgi:hypothetical protein
MNVVKNVKRLEAMGRKLDNLMDEINDIITDAECDCSECSGDKQHVLEDILDSLDIARDSLGDATDSLDDAIEEYYSLK